MGGHHHSHHHHSHSSSSSNPFSKLIEQSSVSSAAANYNAPGSAIKGPDASFTQGNQVNVLNAKSDQFTPDHTHIVQNTGRKVDIHGGVKNGVEHVVFTGKLQNLQTAIPVNIYGSGYAIMLI